MPVRMTVVNKAWLLKKEPKQ